MSFHREVLEQVTPQFQLEPPPRPVQISLRIQDLQGTKLAGWVNREGYKRAVQTSDGDARVLTTLAEEYRLSADQCLAAAQSALNATLIDTLGGKYEAVGQPGNIVWRSSKLTARRLRAISFRP